MTFYVNLDKEIWREREDDFYSPSIHVASSGKIGINVGGTVHVKDVRDWHDLAQKDWYGEDEPTDDTTQASPALIEMLTSLSRKIVSLESQLRDTQGNLETTAEELANTRHRLAKHADRFAAIEDKVERLVNDVGDLDDRSQVLNAINKYYAEGSR